MNTYHRPQDAKHPEQQETPPCSPHDILSQEEEKKGAEKEAKLATYTSTSKTLFSDASELVKRKTDEEKKNYRRYFPSMCSVV